MDVGSQNAQRSHQEHLTILVRLQKVEWLEVFFVIDRHNSDVNGNERITALLKIDSGHRLVRIYPQAENHWPLNQNCDAILLEETPHHSVPVRTLPQMEYCASAA